MFRNISVNDVIIYTVFQVMVTKAMVEMKSEH